jgi:hypothetical protein
MRKLMTVIMVLSLVLGGVALAAAADVPQTSKNLDLSKMQKISDQEAKQLRGTYMSGAPVGAGTGVCPNLTCVPNSSCKDVYNKYLWGGKH